MRKMDLKKIETEITDCIENTINSFLEEQEKFKSRKDKLENFRKIKSTFELKGLLHRPFAKKITYNNFSNLTEEDVEKYGIDYICKSIVYSYLEEISRLSEDIKILKVDFPDKKKIPVVRKTTEENYKKYFSACQKIQKKQPSLAHSKVILKVAKTFQVSSMTVDRAVNFCTK
ncbi:MAG: hypothetical protein J0L87_14300 [Bacteroidetes bacterium]|nr:hypothetical protein [Bacteroidota bacterium]